MGYVLDTTVFNHLLRDGLDPAALPSGAQFFVTHVQLTEVNKTKDDDLRSRLLAIFHAVPSQRIPTKTTLWGVGPWGEGPWGTNPDGLFDKMLAALNKRNNSRSNNGLDILIAETAIRHGYVLVTDDSDLSYVVREFGGAVSSLKDITRRENAC